MIKTTVSSTSNKVSNLSTVFQWNSNIREAVNQCQYKKALILFLQMKYKGLEPNHLTYPILAKACGKLYDLRYSHIIHSQVVKSPFSSDMFVQTAMVDMYIKCNNISYAHNLFERMPRRDIASWNAMLVGFAQLDAFDRVSFLFREMRFEGIQPDSVTVVGITQSIPCLRLLNALHCFGIRIGVAVDVSVSNTWISAYAKLGDLGSSEKVFDGIDPVCRTVVSYNSMITACAHSEKSAEALSFYKQMLICDGYRPDLSTILNLLCSCCRPEALFQGKLTHCQGIKVGCDTDTPVLNTLISMYCKCGDLSSGRRIFDSMVNRTCVSWTVIIGGYAAKGHLDEVLTLFYSMEAAGESPDIVTILNLISGCGETGALEIGQWIDEYVISKGLKNNLMVCNALIDMYAKCGSMSYARDLFDKMHEKSVVSWTSMISGCALNGEFHEALALFSRMLELGEKPHDITYLAVLQACNHAGFIEKGQECYNMMIEVHKLNPGLDHYSCMADLLGRGGRLKAALDFIHNMPVKPDVGIWGALLSACKIHRNVEIGEYAACCLFELDPQSPAPYVEMANIYAAAGRWDGVTTIRKLMKHNRVAKSPGQSIIQVSGKSHCFTVEDGCHPDRLVIYDCLHSLVLQFKGELDSLNSENLYF